jgi:hypothetical protein
MAVTLDTVREFLPQYGWKYQEGGEQLLHVTFSGERGPYLLSIHAIENWYLLTVQTFFKPTDAQLISSLYRQMTLWNYQFKFARTTLNEQGYVIIALDLPADARLTYPLFELGLDVLAYYSDRVMEKLLAMMRAQ